MNSEGKRPFHTWPKAISMKSGMTGFVRISSTSNCTAVAAACRAFTCSRCVHATHFQSVVGMGPAPWVPSLACPVASAPPVSSSLLRRSFSSSVSFFFRCLRLRAGNSFSVATAMEAVELGAEDAPAEAPAFFSPFPDAGASAPAALPSAASGAAAPGSGLKPARASRRKTASRMTGRARKLMSVGSGPMMTVVTTASVPRMMPMRHRYMKNCLTSWKTKLSHRTLRIVLMMPFSNVTRFTARSQAIEA
mmetsp:Transcript_65278/g.183806  ORF Transcript_65278/g.183806 Transcript_65278/m.183806 type:complete len:249 (+) Transcript_65278:1252-1998(+)